MSNALVRFTNAVFAVQVIIACQPSERQIVIRATELERAGERIQAERLLRELLGELEKRGSAGIACTPVVLNNLASIEQDAGNFSAAEALYRRGLRVEEQYGLNHGDETLLMNLGTLYLNTAQYRRGEGVAQRALAIRTARLGPNHPAVARAMQNLAALKYARGLVEDASDLYQGALKIWRQSGMEETPDAAVALNGVGLVYAKSGDLKAALAHVRHALDIWRQSSLAAARASAAKAQGNIAALLLALRKPSEAKTHWLSAVSLAESSTGPQSILTRNIRYGYMMFLEETRQKSEAKVIRRQVQAWDEVHGSPSRRADLIDITELPNSATGR